MTKEEFIEWCKHRHDVFANQKYDDTLPYSQHLTYVIANFHRFSYLVRGFVDGSPYNGVDICEMGCWGHDLTEDARVTYNDLVNRVGTVVADVIYCCQEEKGKTRDERHSDKYYLELSSNRLAIFVKLCDIMANVTYSILTKSSMYDKHKKEHQKTMKYLYREEFQSMYDYLDKLFALWP